MTKFLVCFGTRPEAIKLAPVVMELRKRKFCEVTVVVTAQHRHMLDQVLQLFEIEPDVDLDLMVANQSLERLTAAVVVGVADVIDQDRPDVIIVQGDTTTTFASSLAAFYKNVPVAHVEAGLRTGNKRAPFPEEINRRLTAVMTDWHFAPTSRARDALLAESYPPERVLVVGNTVIDALLRTVSQLRQGKIKPQGLPVLTSSKRMVLITAHRRENFGSGLRAMCTAIVESARQNIDVEYVYPVHLNPNVRKPAFEILSGIPNIYLIEPCDYASFIALLDRSFLVLTDSGGIQEEAPALGKPVLVMRETTERPEAVQAGVAKLVGSDEKKIIKELQHLLDDEKLYARMSAAQNPYGDGTSSQQIADVLGTI